MSALTETMDCAIRQDRIKGNGLISRIADTVEATNGLTNSQASVVCTALATLGIVACFAIREIRKITETGCSIELDYTQKKLIVEQPHYQANAYIPEE